jgi:hypothetical protein
MKSLLPYSFYLFDNLRSKSSFKLPEISEEDRQKMIEYEKTHRCQFKRNKKKKNKLKWRKT